MKKVFFSVLTFCVALCGTLSLHADPVDVVTAKKVATNLFIERGGSSTVDLVDVTSQMPYRNLYFFKDPKGNGFVILSADDRAVPVLGYSIENTFDPADLPAHVDFWFRQYEAEIDMLISDDIETTAEISAEWKRLFNGDPIPVERAREKSVNALLATTWGQGGNSNPTYNYYCPHSGSTYCYAGCTAVATAQVMKYWGHPATGRGAHSYSHNTWGSLSANFAGTTYAWSSMPNSLNSSSSTTQRDAIATLIYHIGVATEMNYGISGSGAATHNYGSIKYPSAENALITNFKYSSNLHSVSKSDYTSAQWISMLKAELDASTPRPILYSGYDTSAGHAFVLDGYDNSNKFHINWGWTSRYDGNYEMGALNPGGNVPGGNASGTYNFRNVAIIGIQPISNNGTSSTVTANVSNSSWGNVSGARSYTNYDTVTLVVNTNEGYRFKQWNDGCKANPRELIVNDNMSISAQLEQITGDTLYYNNSYSKVTSIGVASGSTYYWGVKFPASSLTANRKVMKIMMYVPVTGTYTITVYNDGATAPSSPLFSGSVSFTSSGQLGYNILDLSSQTIPTINHSKPLWVVVKYTNNYNKMVYPASVTYYGGNPYSKYRSSNGTSWSALSYTLSWMIQLINQYTNTPADISEVEFSDNYSITNGNGCITVTSDKNETVRFIDNSGRVIATDNSASNIKTFNAPASGVYLIQVGDKPARKVVVKK